MENGNLKMTKDHTEKKEKNPWNRKGFARARGGSDRVFGKLTRLTRSATAEKKKKPSATYGRVSADSIGLGENQKRVFFKKRRGEVHRTSDVADRRPKGSQDARAKHGKGRVSLKKDLGRLKKSKRQHAHLLERKGRGPPRWRQKRTTGEVPEGRRA